MIILPPGDCILDVNNGGVEVAVEFIGCSILQCESLKCWQVVEMVCLDKKRHISQQASRFKIVPDERCMQYCS